MQKSELIDMMIAILALIDQLPLHPKCKVLLYSRHLLSKISWHFILADLSKTWASESRDNIAVSYVRRWLEIPVCGTLMSFLLKHSLL